MEEQNTNTREKKPDEIDEVMDEIESALKDSKGITSHQKRLAFCLSLGIVDLLENYLNKKNVLKAGYKIDHRLLKKSRANLKFILSTKIICPIENIERLDHILDTAYKIESKRNELAYGKIASEGMLKELIKEFLDVKKKVEND